MVLKGFIMYQGFFLIELISKKITFDLKFSDS